MSNPAGRAISLRPRVRRRTKSWLRARSRLRRRPWRYGSSCLSALLFDLPIPSRRQDPAVSQYDSENFSTAASVPERAVFDRHAVARLEEIFAPARPTSENDWCIGLESRDRGVFGIVGNNHYP